MKVSIKDNPNYTVYLNKEIVDLCVFADEENGYIECYVKDYRGRIGLNENQDPIVIREYGIVKIVKQPKYEYDEYDLTDEPKPYHWGYST